MEIIIVLFSSGVLGIYTYFSLSNKNIVKYNVEDRRYVYLFFALINILIFVSILALFNNVNQVTELLDRITFTRLYLAIIVSAVIIFFLSEFAFPKCFEIYRYLINALRSSKNLTIQNHLPLKQMYFEDTTQFIFLVLTDFEDNVIESGYLIDFTNDETDQNIVLDKEKDYEIIIEKADDYKVLIDFDSNIKYNMYFISPSS